jgi:hypothetical protein
MKLPFKFLILALLTSFTLASTSSFTYFQKGYREKRWINDAKNGKEEFIKTDGLMKNLFNSAFAYVIFPNIGKGGWGLGGATGNGVVFVHDVPIGSAKMTQITIGFQAGGQSYREVLFFENEQALNDFKNNKVEFSAQASAIIAKDGASANVKFKNGVLIFTQPKGGLMYEASVGGQKFNFKSF